MLVVGRVVDEVDFSQQLLLMMLELAHHFGDALGQICDRRGVVVDVEEEIVTALRCRSKSLARKPRYWLKFRG
jgi:hypothetical protein